jgi:hypothetical protein
VTNSGAAPSPDRGLPAWPVVPPVVRPGISGVGGWFGGQQLQARRDLEAAQCAKALSDFAGLPRVSLEDATAAAKKSPTSKGGTALRPRAVAETVPGRVDILRMVERLSVGLDSVGPEILAHQAAAYGPIGGRCP